MKKHWRLLIISAVTAFGQAEKFDVASIKPSDPLSTSSQIRLAPGGVLRITNVPVKTLIRQAYGADVYGGPAWLATQRYDIVAKAEDAHLSEDDLQKMSREQNEAYQARLFAKLRALLEERFQLKVHRESRDLPVYALVVGKRGIKIQASEGHRGTFNATGAAGKTDVTGTEVQMSELARFLSDQMGRNVIDKTGLTGNYDFTLSYAPGLAENDGPSLFTELEEQLGLKLESQKAPVEVLVIDSAEKASEN